MADIEAIASEILGLWGTGRQTGPMTDRYPGMSIADGYAAARRLRLLRTGAGERVVGRKIAFTNRTIWARYNITSPSWGSVFDTTLHELADFAGTRFDTAGMPEPRIEPEIMFGLAAAPEPGMDEAALLGCIGWVALGYEFVQSVYPGWKFTVPDVAASGGLHGALLVGPRQPLGRDPARWAGLLRSFEIDLGCNGVHVAHGRGADVLGSPLAALRDLNDQLTGDPAQPRLSAGEIVSTGTLTDAQPVVAGQSWTATPIGLPLPSITLRV